MKVKVTSRFWQQRQRCIKDKMIPYQWNVINDKQAVEISQVGAGMDSFDAAKSYVVQNFRIAAGKAQGLRGGMVFQDSDAYKWLEAAAYALEVFLDDKLKAECEELISVIEAAQQPDGYLNTYFQVNEPERKYQSLYLSHELYCAGHFIEAACAYHQATGSERVLKIACRLADNIDAHFGPEEGKIHGSDGHEEIELALVRLYRETGEERYLKLSHYLLSVRGQDPEFYTKQMQRDIRLGRKSLIPGLAIDSFDPVYYQADKPIFEQTEANGHAVRVVYLATGIALQAADSHDAKMEKAAQSYWQNIVSKRMFVTGGIGSSVHGERFTADYELPNDTPYCETCASVGLTFFAKAMNEIAPAAAYGNVMERALYNTVLAGVSLDGEHYFYVNPLAVVPEYSKKNPAKAHCKSRRPGWFACACCPPNLARMVMSVGHYFYTQKDDVIYVNLYGANEMETTVNGKAISLSCCGDYPWDGKLTYTVTKGGDFALALRVPDFARVQEISLSINGKAQEVKATAEGFIELRRSWQDGDVLELNLPVTPHFIAANPLIEADFGKVCLSAGPVVYCAEECDNGKAMHTLQVNPAAGALMQHKDDLLEGVNVITCESRRVSAGQGFASGLYQREDGTAQDSLFSSEEQKCVLIPYYAWCNRAEGEMRVWLSTQH